MAFKLKYKNTEGIIKSLKSPLEQDNSGYTGLNFDPSAGYTTKGVKIPSFRDMVSLEQQQAIAKKTDERRAKKRKIKEALEKYGGEQYDPEEEIQENMDAFLEEYGDGV